MTYTLIYEDEVTRVGINHRTKNVHVVARDLYGNIKSERCFPLEDLMSKGLGVPVKVTV